MTKSKNYTFPEFIEFLSEFINDNKSKYKRKINGKNISPQTLINYGYLAKLLTNFHQTGFEMEIVTGNSSNAAFLKKQKKMWQTFYVKFTDYLYDHGHFDNYVGANIKLLKTFCKWLELEKGINIGPFYKTFKVLKEDIPIVVLKPEQFQFLISDETFNSSLSFKMKKTKDLFVFGCTVGLRVSDLKLLRKSNIEIIDEAWYLKVFAKKTTVFTKIKLPYYAIEIIKRNQSNNAFLFSDANKLNPK